MSHIDGAHLRNASAQLPEDQLRRAALHVAGYAIDVEDCRLLLDVLGLTGTVVRSSRTVRNREHARASRARRKETT